MELLDFSIALASGGYEAIHRGPVNVYRRRGSPVVDLAAEGSFAAPPVRVQTFLIDYARHAGVVKGVAESRVLARSRSELVVYQRLDLPILDDRDYTLAVRWGVSGQQLWVKFACANQRGPAPRRGVVRVWVHTGGWLLKPALGGRASQARYQVQLDLGGSLPRWMARSGAGRELPQLFDAIAGQLRR